MYTEIKTFEKVCEKAGVNPADYETASTDNVERFLNGVKRILLIHKVFQGDVKVDFGNDDQPKYRPWFYFEKGKGRGKNKTLSGFRFYDSIYSFSYTYSILSPLLVFTDRSVCDFVGETFEGEFNNVLMISNIQ